MIKKDIFNGNTRDRLESSAREKLYSFFMAEKMLRGGIVNATCLVKEMRANHGLGVVETLVLGQAYIAALLLTSTLKNKDRIRLNIDCSGPVKGIDVESNVFGEVKGFLKNPVFSAQASGEETGVSAFLGAGFLTLTKYLEKAKTPYTGKIALEYGDIAGDLANYYLQSEQTPTAFNLSVAFDSQGEVTGAGGLFIQAMPGADEDLLASAETAIGQMGSIGDAIARSVDITDLINTHFKSLAPVFLKHSRVAFFCRCTRENMLGHLACLGQEDIDDLLEKGPFPLEIKCHNCSSVYTFSKADLEKLKK
ncbi:MAG: Hsp33 family molecular chaperone HslO [Desulfobacteraceae bacterium]